VGGLPIAIARAKKTAGSMIARGTTAATPRMRDATRNQRLRSLGAHRRRVTTAMYASTEARPPSKGRRCFMRSQISGQQGTSPSLSYLPACGGLLPNFTIACLTALDDCCNIAIALIDLDVPTETPALAATRARSRLRVNESISHMPVSGPRAIAEEVSLVPQRQHWMKP
jgi:hypothetical protein